MSQEVIWSRLGQKFKGRKPIFLSIMRFVVAWNNRFDSRLPPRSALSRCHWHLAPPSIALNEKARKTKEIPLNPSFNLPQDYFTPKDILPTAEEMKEAEEFHKLRKEEQKREPNYIPPGADGYTNELGQYYKGGVLFAPITENKNNLV